jgi:hypothetical protein
MKSITIAVVVLCALLTVTSVKGNAVATAETLLSELPATARGEVLKLLHLFLNIKPEQQALLHAKLAGVKTQEQGQTLVKEIEHSHPEVIPLINKMVGSIPKSVTLVRLFNSIGNLTKQDIEKVLAHHFGRLWMK